MRKVMINQATIRTAQVVIQNVVKDTYYKEIPLDIMSDALKDLYIIMVMEDNTEWSGFLCGDEGECFIRLAPEYSATLELIDNTEEVLFYTPYENTGLRITWYRCESRRDRKFEVIAYIA